MYSNNNDSNYGIKIAAAFITRELYKNRKNYVIIFLEN